MKFDFETLRDLQLGRMPREPEVPSLLGLRLRQFDVRLTGREHIQPYGSIVVQFHGEPHRLYTGLVLCGTLRKFFHARELKSLAGVTITGRLDPRGFYKYDFSAQRNAG